jgi:hypothetical protein
MGATFHFDAASTISFAVPKTGAAYTIVVARQFSLSAGPTMVLNTNYSATDIPVRDGVGPINGTTSLTQIAMKQSREVNADRYGCLGRGVQFSMQR